MTKCLACGEGVTELGGYQAVQSKKGSITAYWCSYEKPECKELVTNLGSACNILYRRAFITGEIYEGQYDKYLKSYKKKWKKIKGDKTVLPNPRYWRDVRGGQEKAK